MQNKKSPLLAGCLLALAFASACGAPAETQPTSRATVKLVLPDFGTRDYQSAAAATPLPEWFQLTVSAPDLNEPLTVTGTVGESVSVDVPAGADRVFTAEIHRNASLTYLTWTGASEPVNLAAGEAADVVIDLQRGGENTGPELEGVALSPSPIYTDSLVKILHGEAFDFEGDSTEIKYAWFRNGAPVPDQDTAELSGDHFQRGDRLYASVTVGDGISDQQFGTPEIEVLNSAPRLEGMAQLERPTLNADIILAMEPTPVDADGDEVTVSYAWYIDDTQVDWTENYLPSSFFAKHDAVQCVITPFDGTDAGTPVVSNKVFARRRGKP